MKAKLLSSFIIIFVAISFLSFKTIYTKKTLSKVVVTSFMQSIDTDEDFGGGGKSDLFVKIKNSSGQYIYEAANPFWEVSCCPCNCVFTPQSTIELTPGGKYTLEIWDKEKMTASDLLHSVVFTVDKTEVVYLLGAPINPEGKSTITGSFSAEVYWKNSK